MLVKNPWKIKINLPRSALSHMKTGASLKYPPNDRRRDNTPSRIYAPNKTEDVSLDAFNLINKNKWIENTIEHISYTLIFARV